MVKGVILRQKVGRGLIGLALGVMAIMGGCSRPPDNSVCRVKGEFAPTFVCCGSRLIGVGKVSSTRIDKKALADSIAVSQLWARVKEDTLQFLKLTGLKADDPFWKGLKEKVYKGAIKIGEWERNGVYYSAFQIPKEKVVAYIYLYFNLTPNGKEDKLLDELF